MYVYHFFTLKIGVFWNKNDIDETLKLTEGESYVYIL